MSRNEAFRDGRQNDLLNEIADRSWFHGTSRSGADAVARSQKADFRGIQIHGPGFYVTPNEEHAEEYARSTGHSYDPPTVQSGIPMVEKAIQITHSRLRNLGAQFRESYPAASRSGMHDAALGNIALRKQGYDFMHVIQGAHGDPIDVGVILRPKKWIPLEDRDA